MTFKLNKDESKELSSHVDKIKKSFEDMEQAIKDYNNCLEAAKEFIEDKANDWQSEYDDRSETWQNGDKGTAVAELISSWENCNSLIDVVEIPEDITESITGLEQEVGE